METTDVNAETRLARPVAPAPGPLAYFSPQNLTEAMTLAKMVADSDLVPKDYRGKSANVIVAWQLGAELGLHPMQAVQNIAVINGRPGVWGDAVLALVMGRNVLADFSEWFEGEGDNLTAYCKVTRKGIPTPFIRSFSVADAKAAGLFGKDTYRAYLKRMLQMRARGFALRDSCPDVLKGTYLAEELEGDPFGGGGETAPAMPRRASETVLATASGASTTHLIPVIDTVVVGDERDLAPRGEMARQLFTEGTGKLATVATPPAPAPAAGPDRPAPVPPTIEEATKAPEGEAVLVKAIDAQSGEKNGKPWTLYVVRTQDGRAFKTFNQKHADAATEAKSTGAPLIVTLDVTPRGIMIVGAHVG